MYIKDYIEFAISRSLEPNEVEDLYLLLEEYPEEKIKEYFSKRIEYVSPEPKNVISLVLEYLQGDKELAKKKDFINNLVDKTIDKHLG